MKNGDTATIREVYEIAYRLEGKIDELNGRLALAEGKMWIIATILPIIITYAFNLISKGGVK